MTDPVLTPLGVMVLALLREGDMHPYEMARLLRARREDRIVSITNGTLYHTVSRLHGQGLIDEVGVDRDGNRPERTTYTLTSTGFTAVGDWVRRELGATGRPTFPVAIAEAHNLERGEAIDLLWTRREVLAQEFAAIDAALHEATTGGVFEQYLLEATRHRILLQAEIDWLDDLIPRMATPEFAWGNDPEHFPATRKAHRHG